jgi:3-hydroxyacyl-[acyl-carrier-protein] dehydratase
MKSQEIISKLPYSKPFRLLMKIIQINETVEGHFTFNENLDFIRVILKIIQWHRCYLNRDNGSDRIGLSWYIYIDNNFNKNTSIALTSRVWNLLNLYLRRSVISEKIYSDSVN